MAALYHEGIYVSLFWIIFVLIYILRSFSQKVEFLPLFIYFLLLTCYVDTLHILKTTFLLQRKTWLPVQIYGFQS